MSHWFGGVPVNFLPCTFKFSWTHGYALFRDKGFEIKIYAYEHVKVDGCSTDTFESIQTLNVHGRKFIGTQYN